MKSHVYLILRLGLGFSLFGHGLVRLSKLTDFSKWMISSFKDSMLPEFIVAPFSYALPILEFIIGLLLLLGLFSKHAFFTGSVVMLSLLFGTCLIENWEAVPSQLIHLAFFAVLLNFADANSYSLDRLLLNKKI